MYFYVNLYRNYVLLTFVLRPLVLRRDNDDVGYNIKYLI